MKLLQMGKDMKINYSVSHPPSLPPLPHPPPPPLTHLRTHTHTQNAGTFFLKKTLDGGGTKFFGQIYGEMFYLGTNDLKGRVKFSFPLIDAELCN